MMIRHWYGYVIQIILQVRIFHESLDSFYLKYHHVPVLIDEAYFEFVTAEDYPDTLALQQKYDNAFLLRTFSKAYGLAGLRVGYVVASEHAIEKWNIIRPPFNVTRISEYAAVAALEDQQYLKEVTHKNNVERERFINYLKVSISYQVKRILYL